MELQFQKVNENEWVAEFQATADFNLHIERVSSGSITVAQRGTESGEYDTAWAKGVYEGQRVIDYDFGALVYPKWIKVTSSSEVISCVVNFSAGGGSGTGGGETAGNYRYYDVSAIENEVMKGYFTANAYLIKGNLGTGAKVLEAGASFITRFLSRDYINHITQVCIDWDTPRWIDSNKGTLSDILSDLGITIETFESAAVVITKEEFYTI